MRYHYDPRTDRIETRRAAAIDFLASIGLAVLCFLGTILLLAI